MNDIKPKFFISHDDGGLHIWLSKKRPERNLSSRRYECPGGVKMRLPYSWFGHIVRENSMIPVDIEGLVTATVDGAWD